jgi:hypothetical protein
VPPAEDEVTSLTALGGNAHHGPAAFTTTHWSVVLEAQGESPAAQEALEKLCRTYWRPIYSFVRRQGVTSEEAEDITQGFFVQLLARRSLNAVRKENALRQAFYRFRQRYQSLLREEIAHTVATPGDIEDELRHLISAVRG